MRKKIKLVLINILVFFGILLLLEGIIRISYSTIRTQGTDKHIISQNVYKTSNGLTKNYTGNVFGASVTVDEYHFRETGIPFNPTKKSIVLLGDSVTMGVGVNDSETFAAEVQKATPNYNIVNPSVIGFDTYDYKNVVTTLLENEEFQTEKILIFFCLNDIYNRSTGDTAPMMSQKPFIGEIFDFLKSNSHLYIWLKGTFFDRQQAFFRNDSQLYTEANLNAIGENLSEIAEKCAEKKVSLNVVILPYEYQLRNYQNTDASTYQPQLKLSEKLTALGIKSTLSGSYLYKNTSNHEELYLFADGIHFSPKGHKIIAQYIQNEILNKQ